MSRRIQVLLALVGGSVGVAVLLMGGGHASAETAPRAESATVTSFAPVPAARVLAPKALGAGQTVTVQVAGRGGVPSGATAVTGTVVASGATTPGRVTVYEAGTRRPTPPTAYVAKRQTVSAPVTVALSPTGKVTLHNAVGRLSVVLDVTGYYAPATGSGPSTDELEERLDDLGDRVQDLSEIAAEDSKTIASLSTRLDAAEQLVDGQQTLLAGISRVQVDGYPTLRVSGVNLQVVNGSGTQTTANGLGNLIVGYNPAVSGNTRTGSHNLVLGARNSWTATSGLVSGIDNRVTGEGAVVLGGQGNVASGLFSGIVGGASNDAEGLFAATLGGSSNFARGDYSAVVGGSLNRAIGTVTSVTGGTNNFANGDASSISGGRSNTANGVVSSMTAGYLNIADGELSSVTGGYSNRTVAEYSSISGGSSNTATNYCQFIPPMNNC